MIHEDVARVIGLTGGIASGKSTVAHLLREQGASIVDADIVAREVVAPGSDGAAKIRSRFGNDVFLPDGNLDRKRLGGIIFADSEARAELDRITHPLIAAASQANIEQYAAQGVDPVIYEAALIVENGLHHGLDGLIVVKVESETQIARLVTRDGIDEGAARDRIAAQLPLSAKLAVATWVVDNSGTPEQTQQQVAELWQTLRSEP